MSVYVPILITPQGFERPLHIRSFGNEITQEESYQSSLQSSKDSIIGAMIFVGGFRDSIARAVFNAFYAFCQKDFWKFYITHNGIFALAPIFDTLASRHIPIYIVAHSWGASNTIFALQKAPQCIKYLLTLDAVGYRPIKKALNQVEFWENIYIAKHPISNLPNLAAFLGSPRRAIAYANLNTPLEPPAHHNSILKMLHASQQRELFKHLFLG